MKLQEISDDTPLIYTLLQNLLKKGEKVRIRDRDGLYRDLTMVIPRKLDRMWVLRGVRTELTATGPIVKDLRLPVDADADYLLNLHKSEETNGWVLHPRWQRIRELGYQ